MGNKPSYYPILDGWNYPYSMYFGGGYPWGYPYGYGIYYDYNFWGHNKWNHWNHDNKWNHKKWNDNINGKNSISSNYGSRRSTRTDAFSSGSHSLSNNKPLNEARRSPYLQNQSRTYNPKLELNQINSRSSLDYTRPNNNTYRSSSSAPTQNRIAPTQNRIAPTQSRTAPTQNRTSPTQSSGASRIYSAPTQSRSSSSFSSPIRSSSGSSSFGGSRSSGSSGGRSSGKR